MLTDVTRHETDDNEVEKGLASNNTHLLRPAESLRLHHHRDKTTIFFNQADKYDQQGQINASRLLNEFLILATKKKNHLVNS